MSSTTSMGTFHGTAISIRTHPNGLKDDNDFLRMEDIPWSKNSLNIKSLPSHYSVVEPIPEVDRKCLKITYAKNITDTSLHLKNTVFEDALKGEQKWLDFVDETLKSNELMNPNVYWSSYHANLEIDSSIYPSTIGLLPLFQDAAHTYSMMNHALKITENDTRRSIP